MEGRESSAQQTKCCNAANDAFSPGGEDHAIGRSRGGLSTKINAVVDENGLPVRLSLTAGQAHDLIATPALIAGLPSRHVVADRGYDSDAFLDLIRAGGAKAQIPSTRSRKIQRSVSRRRAYESTT